MNRSERYARLPFRVLEDVELSSDAKLVYAILAAYVKQGNVCNIGQRKVAGILKMSQPTVSRHLRALEKNGHIKTHRQEKGQRSWYLLTSEVFAQKQRAGAEEVVSAPSGGYRLASVVRSALSPTARAARDAARVARTA